MNILNLEEDRIKSIEVNGHKFKIRFMSPMDRVQIAQHRMRLQGGNPVESLTQDDFIFFENIAIVNTCVEEFPKGFKENESCIKWEDIELINGVAGEIRKHTNDIESKLKKNRHTEGSE
jgi:hypothetical protein